MERVELRDVLNYEQPSKYLVNSEDYDDFYKTPVLTAGKSFLLGYTAEEENIFSEVPVIIFDDFTTSTQYVDFPFKVKSSAMKILKCNDSKAEIKYLFYLMKLIKFDAVRHKRYWISEYSKIKIPLPDLSTQKSIAARLDQAEAVKTLNQQLLAKYDELGQSIFLEMFGGYITSREEALSDLVKINPRKSELVLDDESVEVSFVSMSDVGEKGEFDSSETRTYKEVKTGFTYFKERDVLFAKITPCMENGKGAIANRLKNEIGFGSTEFHVIRPNEDLNSQFLYHFFALKSTRKLAEMYMTGSAGQKRVPKEFFKKLKINPPPLNLQTEFARRIENIERQKELLRQEIDKSEALFQSLLQESFTFPSSEKRGG